MSCNERKASVFFCVDDHFSLPKKSTKKIFERDGCCQKVVQTAKCTHVNKNLKERMHFVFLGHGLNLLSPQELFTSRNWKPFEEAIVVASNQRHRKTKTKPLVAFKGKWSVLMEHFHLDCCEQFWLCRLSCVFLASLSFFIFSSDLDKKSMGFYHKR